VERNYFPKPFHIVQELQKFGFPPEMEEGEERELAHKKHERRVK
jgi:hypothetical protein